MAIWITIMLTVIAVFVAAAVYLSEKIPKLLHWEKLSKWSKLERFFLGLLITSCVIGLLTLCLDFVNAIVCVVSLAMIWAAADFVFRLTEKIAHTTFRFYYAGWTALAITTVYLGTGWYLNHHVWQTNYELTTDKDVPAFKIAMLADVHLGTTFDADGFAGHLKKIEAQNPDIVVVVGDYVDDGTSKAEMIKASKALGRIKTKYGVYFVFGNHDRGYYGPAYRGFSARELVDELENDGIVVLSDETVLIDGRFYLIGRKDLSAVKELRGSRLSMNDLTGSLDKNKYMIVLDHQPADFENQAKTEADLVLCGHTHGGQLFPFNQVGKWIGANDLVYGHEKRNKTDFIVTSGISDWAIKFKTGTKSEFVIITIKSKGK